MRCRRNDVEQEGGLRMRKDGNLLPNGRTSYGCGNFDTNRHVSTGNQQEQVALSDQTQAKHDNKDPV